MSISDMEIEFSGLISRSFKDATIYLPIEEAIVNAIHSIKDLGNINEGLITVRFLREKVDQGLFDGKDKKKAGVIGVEIEDNGIGFTDENKNSFSRIFSSYKSNIGGIGFGRVSYLKFFDDVFFESYYINNGDLYERKRKFVIGDDVFGNLKEGKSQEKRKSGTKVTFNKIKGNGFQEIDFETIVRRIVERLVGFYAFGEKLPKIEFIDDDNGATIELEKFLSSTQNIQVLKTKNDEISIKDQVFKVKLVKIHKTQLKNSINLCGHNRIVIRSAMKSLIPLFDEWFVEKNGDKFIIQVFVASKYLDDRVNTERNAFDNIPKTIEITDQSLFQDNISMELIYLQLKEFIIDNLDKEYKTREQKRKEIIDKFFNENPYYNDIKDQISYEGYGQDIKPVEIEREINEKLFNIRMESQEKVKKISEKTSIKELEGDIGNILEGITLTQRTDLARYIIGRKLVLDLMEKNLNFDLESGTFEKEETLHEILFPRYKDNTNSPYKDNALWIIDEKMNFEKYVASECGLNIEGKNKKSNKTKQDRIDIGVFGEAVAFRGEDKASTPITVFELKRPGRTDFVGGAVEEDPIEQITRYLNGLRDGTYKTKNKVEINASMDTPAYGYLICTIDQKVKNRLTYNKGFKILPDGEGYVYFNEPARIIIRAISRKQLIQDAKNRNKIFFEKLGINDK